MAGNMMMGHKLAMLAALALGSGYGVGLAGQDVLRDDPPPQRKATRVRDHTAYTHTEKPKGKRAKRRARGKARSNAS